MIEFCPGSSRYDRIYGRYITPDSLSDLLAQFNTEIIGHSVLGEAIRMVTLGHGPKKILAWSQMHGNESTTTKAVADFLYQVSQGNHKGLLDSVTLKVVLILNPDGARAYTRENAAGVDLNRDFAAFSQPESKALFAVFESFGPQYCFNLHDQRTIFGADGTGKPATVSFLAPAFDTGRSLNTCREKAMEIIAAINDSLQKCIPGMVGRFDDSFNANCVGDAFTSMGASTILFEAGHFPGDYQRETTRDLIASAFCEALRYISENDVVGNRTNDYLMIPQNKICFYDFVYKNVKINYDSNEIITNFAVQYREFLFEGEIKFAAEVAAVGNLDKYFGHKEFDANGALYQDEIGSEPHKGSPANFWLGTQRFENGIPAG